MDWIYTAKLHNSWWLFRDSGGKPIKIKSDTCLYTAVEANVITCNCFNTDISNFTPSNIRYMIVSSLIIPSQGVIFSEVGSQPCVLFCMTGPSIGKLPLWKLVLCARVLPLSKKHFRTQNEWNINEQLCKKILIPPPGGPSCDMIILRNNSHGGIIRVCEYVQPL